ncbi:DUF1573 domain-containing protein [Pedobacter sp. KR3-3]|uniref:DUF1573 domain-containing protein n=1 Tax=Pedobacter albus TaxID=3113905 RepID=A0ABU7I8G9_9SPHI|nr:DUF1573 domain-containing protein [Pedobacter sp. KR3-3]MEE1945765.1 DUF1573 domain-containing protein [Pedobacter sp. KR3-3]
MKKLIVLFAAVVSFVAVTAMKDVQPEFKFEKETHDFGKIPQGKPVNVTLKFKNVGDQPLIISAVEPACGCTVAKYTQTPVKKGESGFVELTYNAAAVGVFTKATTIKSNSKDPVKTIIIKGEVVAAATSK